MNEKLVIDVTGLNKSFDGKPAVIDVAMQVRRGEIYGFMGPNGSGKTTTIRMLCGLLTPDSGSGHCLGYNILTESSAIKRQVGYMTQAFSLYGDLSIEENLDFSARVYGVKDRKKRVEQGLVDLGLQKRRKQLAGTLSGGWKQRLSLATALLHQPQLLLLDEPTAGVDPKARREFWEQIHLLADQGITALVSTHYMDEAERCHRLAYIAYGNMLVQGTVQEVIQKAGLTTWSVTAEHLNALARELKTRPGIEQVVVLGNVLHVSGRDADALEKSIMQIKKPDQHWEPSSPSLEDIFIHLVGEEPERYYE